MKHLNLTCSECGFTRRFDANTNHKLISEKAQTEEIVDNDKKEGPSGPSGRDSQDQGERGKDQTQRGQKKQHKGGEGNKGKGRGRQQKDHGSERAEGD